MVEQAPPERWRITPLARSNHDFEWLASQEPNFFRSLETINDLADERKRLTKQLERYMIVSSGGAALVILGGFPEDAQLSVFGLTGSLSAIPIQILSLVIAVMFMRFWYAFISLFVLNQMITHLISVQVGDQNVEFVLARYDASTLWLNLLRPRTIGYESDGWHKAYAGLLALTGLGWIIIFVTLVFAALVSATHVGTFDTLAAGTLAALAYVALAGAIVSTLIFFIGFLIPLPYRQSAEMRDFLARQATVEAPVQNSIDEIAEPRP